VDVGEKMIGSGVNVSVGSCMVGCRVWDKAVSTNPAITVSAAAVLMASASVVAIAGTAQPKAASIRMMTDRETRLEWDIAPPGEFEARPRQKGWPHSDTEWVHQL